MKLHIITKWLTMKKILFISGGKTITSMFIDIIKELDNEKVLVLNRDYYFGEDSAKSLSYEGIPTIGIETYKTKNIKKILKEEEPHVVVVGNDNNAIERSFILGSADMGIPSLLVQDGIINLPKTLSTKASLFGLIYLLRNSRIILPQSLYLLHTCGLKQYLHGFVRLKKSHSYGHGECTKVAVMSPYAKSVFSKLGFNSDNIIITGQPRFDELFNPKFTKSEVYKKIGLSSSYNIALLASPVFATLENGAMKRRIFIEGVAKAFKPYENTKLIIKLHPGLEEQINDYQVILNSINYENAIIVKDFDVSSLLTSCSIFLSNFSTMAMEALILDKPTVIVNIFNDSEYYPFVSSGAAIGVSNINDLGSTVQRITTDHLLEQEMKQSRETFVREHAYKDDGNASKRVACLIREMSIYKRKNGY